MTISEMLETLAAERGVQASRATLWIFLDRCGLTFKKSPRTRTDGDRKIRTVSPLRSRFEQDGWALPRKF